MPRVHILDDAVVNQIAAGEVVERPVSVVKELVENAIDAGASEITVVIANGGRTSIEVIDNGCGMTKDDALLAVERFGTSKISGVDDLQAIATLGFRGEALPSIASVSHFTLVTCAQGSGRGVSLVIEGGVLRDCLEGSMAPGTRVTVRQLFFNVPARRKFLRGETTETGLIKTLLADFSLSHPQLRLRLVADGSDAALFPQTASFAERLVQQRVGGAKALELLRRIDTEAGPVIVSGALSQPINSVSSSGKLRLIVNGRSVRDKLLLRAARDGYGHFLKASRYPTGVIKLDLPPAEVDVNVHPQKAEVRFRKPDLIFAAVHGAVSQALKAVQPLYQNAETAVYPLRQTADNEGEFALMPGSGPLPYSPAQRSNALKYQDEAAGILHKEQGSAPAGRTDSVRTNLSSMRYLGQIFDLYLLFAGTDVLAIVDMHAAHERVNFYRLKQQLLAGPLPVQKLLLPETVELPLERLEQFQSVEPVLRRLGIEAEPFGEGCLIVRALPALLGGVSAAAIFDDLLSISEWSDWGVQLEERWDGIIARLACHGSVRSGRQLEREEVYQLLASLEEVESSGFCPHGRPVAKFIGISELAGMFGRI